MKKLSLLTIAAVTGFSVFAQDMEKKPLRTEMATSTRFGLRGGVNFTNLEFDDDYSGTTYNTNNKTSFQVGAFVNIPVGTNFRIQPEVSYVGQGAKIKGTPVSNALSAQQDYELDMHYIAVPVMFQLHTGSNGLFFEAGPQGSFLLKAQEQPSNNSGPDINLKERKLVKKTDFALAAGLGYVSRVGLGLNARYVHGVSNVFDSEGAPSGTNEREISNRGIQVGLVYHFGAYK